MPYYFHEEEIEGEEAADVVTREDYDAVITERDEVMGQRDDAISRAEVAETKLTEARNKYANAFFNTRDGAKKEQADDIKRESKVATFAELFSGRDRNAN